MRGGSWNNNPQNVRVSNRNRNEPTNRNNNIGFRCAGYTEPGPSFIRARRREPVSSTEVPGVLPPFPGCDPDARVTSADVEQHGQPGFSGSSCGERQPGLLSSLRSFRAPNAKSDRLVMAFALQLQGSKTALWGIAGVKSASRHSDVKRPTRGYGSAVAGRSSA